MKRPYRLTDMTSNSTKFAISINYNGKTINFLSASATTRYLEENFGEFYYLSKYDPGKTNEDNIRLAKDHFAEIFELWKNDNMRNFEFMYSALYSDYNPLENYDRKEDGSYTDEHHKGSKTATSYKETTTPNLTTETTNRTKIKSSDFVFGFDSATASPTGYTETQPTDGTDKIAQTGTTKTERIPDDNYISTTDISDSVFDRDRRTYDEYHIHGNVGVTKTTELIRDELSLRMESLANNLIFSFANKYLFYSDCLEVVE